MENVEAYTLLGMYFNSENNNIKKDYQKAKDYLEKAANKITTGRKTNWEYITLMLDKSKGMRI